MGYKHFTSEQRAELSVLLRAGLEQDEIAILLDKNPSSISREINRNSDERTGNYHAKAAKIKTRLRREESKRKQRKIKNDSDLEKYIILKLKKFWSPEQIAGRLKLKQAKIVVGKDAIYQYIYSAKPGLIKYLRFKKNKYRRRRGTKIREELREEAKKRRIDVRPGIIGKRERIGDWEGDTIIGKDKKSAILTHVERKSGYLMADKLDTRTSNETMAKIIQRFKNIPKFKRFTGTYDNGPEFSSHQEIERFTSMVIYFAFPYHSWERGSNENTNGLLRQFFPKGIPFVNITQEDIDNAVLLLNNRPRKRLDYFTPKEIFSNCTSS